MFKTREGGWGGGWVKGRLNNVKKTAQLANDGFPNQNLRFSFDGTRINENNTPKGLLMEVSF